jgi:hypothetical protein
MPDLSTIDSDELKARIGTVFDKIDAALREIGPRVKEIGLLRTEASEIYDELERRGLVRGNVDGGQVRESR